MAFYFMKHGVTVYIVQNIEQHSNNKQWEGDTDCSYKTTFDIGDIAVTLLDIICVECVENLLHRQEKCQVTYIP